MFRRSAALLVAALFASVAAFVVDDRLGGSQPAAAACKATMAPWVGAYAHTDGKTPQQAWDAAQRDIGAGQLTYRRSFDPTIPAVGNEAWRDTNATHNFYSVKPPNHDITGYINGKYDTRLRDLAKAMPQRTKFTVYHEPEDNMSGQTFYKITKKTVDVVKAVRPDIEIWYVAMAYQWETNSKGNVGTNAGWVDAAKIVDHVGLDVYAPGYSFKSIEDDKGFQRWHDLIVEPTCKVWGIIERGITRNKGDAARAQLLKEDFAFIKESGAKMLLYWDGNVGPTADKEGWYLDRSQERAAYRDIAGQGR